jgi:hypothetical protein
MLSEFAKRKYDKPKIFIFAQSHSKSTEFYVDSKFVEMSFEKCSGKKFLAKNCAFFVLNWDFALISIIFPCTLFSEYCSQLWNQHKIKYF